MEEILQLDKEAFIYLNNLGSETWDWFWILITHKFASVPLYIFLAFLLVKKFGWKYTGIVMLGIALMITCTDQLANVFKDGFQRPRPCNEDFINQARELVHCGKYGYFSAHAASSSALAIYLGNILKKRFKFALPAMILWALVVSYSRIYVGVHYPSDTLTGIFIGALIGYIFYLVLNYTTSRLNLRINTV